MEKYVDLHVHSSYSDGVYRPGELVAMAAEKGLKAIAIADHDSVEGVDEALAAAEKHGIEVVPAVEFSVAYGTMRDIHLLGYYIDHADAEFRDKLARFRERRDSRARAIVDRINAKLAREKKSAITYDDVRALARNSVSRLHIASVLVRAGMAENIQAAFKQYLGPCDVPKEYFPMGEAIGEIRRIGGVAVLAHPPTITNDRRLLGQLVGEWCAMGLDGIEVFNNLSYKDDMIFFENLAREKGLLMTGGSDFHGYEDDVEIGIGSGGLAVAYSLLLPMKKRARDRGPAI